jgi:hypothetical protein
MELVAKQATADHLETRLMLNIIQFWTKTTLLGIWLTAATTSGGAWAQGSAGGSIGNDDKAVSGARQERAVEREQPARRRAEQPRGPAPRRSEGGGGNFDGAWIVNAVGVTCQGTSSNAVVVTSGKIIGNNVTSGRVSPNGAVYATGGSNGLTNVTTGRLSGRSGSGSFRQSDGCVGRWTASKQ